VNMSYPGKAKGIEVLPRNRKLKTGGKKMRNNKGFTLIEMVVVLAVVAILAAILTPTIAKNINDAKIARANNEVQVIASAIGSFYKDLGRWPTSYGAALTDTLHLLYGPGDTPTAQGAGVANEQYWLNAGGWGVALIDTFSHQLVENNPGGGAVNYADDTTVPRPEFRWRGPYITQVNADPWGCHYSCNIWYTYNTTTNFVGVWSAGPNRISNTSAIQPAVSMTVGGDDVIFRLQ